MKRKKARFDGICPECGLLPKLIEKSYCRPCVVIRDAEYRRKYPDRIKASKIKHFEKMRDIYSE